MKGVADPKEQEHKNKGIRDEGSYILASTGNGTTEGSVDKVSSFKTLTKEKDALFLTSPW